MEAESDLILERLNRDFPGLVPQSGQQWVQYLLDWRQVMEDETGVVRRRLQEERRRLRFELGISQELVAGTGRAWDRGIALEHFWFLYEKDYYDPEAQAFRAQKLADHVRQDFGTVDAICLWQGYPRLGLDHRNQFDYLRDLPGGVTGLRTTVSVLQAAGMRCFLAYNPWDTGTRREPKSDAETLADILRATGADGVFLDTLSGADASLRETLRAARPEIAVCPELIPSLGDLSRFDRRLAAVRPSLSSVCACPPVAGPRVPPAIRGPLRAVTPGTGQDSLLSRDRPRGLGERVRVVEPLVG